MLSLLRRHSRRIPVSALSRGLWATMLACHVPALITTWVAVLRGGIDVGQLGGFLLLNASVAFFVLKVRGVGFLEFRTDRRSLVAVTVAVALMHADAIGTRLDYQAVPAEIPVAASTLFAAGLTRVQSAMRGLVSRRAESTNRRARPAATADTACFGAFAPRRWILNSCVRIPRAPPA